MNVIKQHWFLIFLTLIICSGCVYTLFFVPADKGVNYGTIIGGFGGVLAFIWFFAGLKSQSIQLQEQREQFLAEFKTLRDESRRNALAFSKDILHDAEKRALAQNPNLERISDLISVYMEGTVVAIKVFSESTDVEEIKKAAEIWKEAEGPAVTIIKGIKNAAEIYLRAIEAKDVDYSKEPEEFVFVYGPLISKLPFFESYEGMGTMLSQYMFAIQPGRKAAALAILLAAHKGLPEDILRQEKILEEVEELGNAAPAIAKEIFNT